MCLVGLYMLCVVLQVVYTVSQDMVTAETKVVELCAYASVSKQPACQRFKGT